MILGYIIILGIYNHTNDNRIKPIWGKDKSEPLGDVGGYAPLFRMIHVAVLDKQRHSMTVSV